MKAVLFHVSEEPNLDIFLPRSTPQDGPLLSERSVWAIDEAHVVNYLLPRDCPRVTFAVTASTSEADRTRFFPAGVSRLVTIEANWLVRAMGTAVYVYTLLPETFELSDANAGYWISRERVKRQSVTEVLAAPLEIIRRGGELRLVESLWPLHDVAAASTLEFSMIRMRHAKKSLAKKRRSIRSSLSDPIIKQRRRNAVVRTQNRTATSRPRPLP